MQAGVGAHVIDDDPAEAKRSLEAISDTSRSTLTEIRRLLGVLRSDGAAAYQPAPGLGDLDRLVADLDVVGVPVTVAIEGAPERVPAGVDLTAYRIVQEALTNVLKHAGPARACVTVAYRPGAVGARDHRRRARRERLAPPDGRPRPARHARAGRRLRRHARDRPAGRRRLPGRGRAPLRGGRMIRVAVADDQALVRSGFTVLLRSATDIEVVGEAGNGRRGGRPRDRRRTPTSCSWTSACRRWTASRRLGGSRRAAPTPGSSSSPRSTSTSTSSRRCAPARAGSC